MIRLRSDQLDDIHAQAEAAYPFECCGLLAGRTDSRGEVTLTRVVPSPNTLHDETAGGGMDRFEVDPQVRFDLMRALSGTEEEIIGHYHSHPDHPAEPSETDVNMAFEPEMIWLICAVSHGQAEVTQAFQLNRDTQEITRVDILNKTV
ncbi:M67 family metallopeptidase [Magnetovibrio sp. PR-2]|uniref:M67 family metallopeptidase n=1 Tax=Magnetovibrio sp. PR-2 TaxID=3120356 RepID=UPI002FCDF0FD